MQDMLKSNPARTEHKQLKFCLACGRPLENRRQRYCRTSCKQELVFKLHWFNNLFRVLNTRYATFAFSQEMLLLNILPRGNGQAVHSYFYARRSGKKPAQDINQMVFDLGAVWWEQKNKACSSSKAGNEVFKQGCTEVFSAQYVQPSSQYFASRVSRQLSALKLKPSELKDVLLAEEKIKDAFRRAALEHHPDHGGSNKKFRQIYQAYQDLLAWLQKPVFQYRQGVPEQWCFIAASNKWLTPL